MAAVRELSSLASDLEKIEAKKWIRDLGLPDTISTIEFAAWCLEQEGLEGVTEDLAQLILWECTGFPCFWQIGVDGDTPIQCLHTQLRGWAKVAVLSKDKASKILAHEDPWYGWREAIAEIEAESRETTRALLEDD